MGGFSLLVNVKLFAILRERAGVRQVALQLPDHATVSFLLDKLRNQYPNLLPGNPSIMIAVNQEYVGLDGLLTDGDEVALIPPVSGGAP